LSMKIITFVHSSLFCGKNKTTKQKKLSESLASFNYFLSDNSDFLF